MPILLTVLGFLWWWPLGLLILAFLIARRGRFGCWRHPAYAWDGSMVDQEHAKDHWDRKMARMQEKMERFRARMERVRGRGDWFGPTSSGNRAFDDYRAETLKRLEVAARVQGFPGAAALRQGPRGIRSVHGRAAPAPFRAGFAGRPIAGSAARLTSPALRRFPSSARRHGPLLPKGAVRRVCAARTPAPASATAKCNLAEANFRPAASACKFP